MIKRLNTFSFRCKSELEQKVYEGTFTMKIPGMIERTQINVRKAQILGGMHCARDEFGVPTGLGVDDATEFTAYVQAWLELCLVQKPDWFTFDPEKAPMDEKVFTQVWKEASKFENTFRNAGRPQDSAGGGSAPNGEADGATQPPQANGGSGPTQVVGGQVQAALEP